MAELEIVFWHWWVLAVFLLGIEILAPGFFFLWLSVAGLIVGAFILLVPATSLELQLIIFGLLSIVSIFLWRRYGKQQLKESDQPLLNKKGAQYIGRVFSLMEPIKNGRGKIKVDDTIWTIEGKDCSIDTTVEIVAINGTIFKVKIIEKI